MATTVLYIPPILLASTPTPMRTFAHLSMSSLLHHVSLTQLASLLRMNERNTVPIDRNLIPSKFLQVLYPKNNYVEYSIELGIGNL